MKTRFNIGQTVLLKGLVKAIRINEDGKIFYFVTVNANREFALQENLDIEETELVCGWIGGEE